ncbi:MAG: PRC-barrel domain containing protein [Planctomycetota bacterium]|nr:MAG: PRC-barrel domain containing protein [Planctomycetota bacterium]
MAAPPDDIPRREALPQGKRTANRVPQAERPKLERRGSNAHAASVRASEVSGMNIQNGEGKNVGEINDLVIDANNGRIRYAAVTYGGFLGVGNKMFAVPWEAFECRQDPNNPDQRTLVLNVTQEQLEGSQGFDEDNWPDFANAEFTQDLDRRYRIERRQQRRQARDIDVEVDRNGIDVDVDPDQE